jgi:hypothetical protein
MDKQPEIVSFGRSDAARPALRWPWIVAVACLILVVADLAAGMAQRAATIGHLRAELRIVSAGQARLPTSAALPLTSATAFHTFPDGSHASFSLVATAISPRPGAAPMLWLYIHGPAIPGQRYGLLGDVCGGQFVTPTDWAQATADSQGDLTIVAPDLPGQPADPALYVLVYQQDSGVTLGGIKGPLVSTGATPFRTAPPC